jgi:hypothetical protein
MLWLCGYPINAPFKYGSDYMAANNIMVTAAIYRLLFSKRLSIRPICPPSPQEVLKADHYS